MLRWLDFSDKERVALTPRIWARCESATMNPFRNKLKVIENRNSDAMSFISERLPGTGGVRHLAVFSHEEASFSRIYRAVPLEGEVPEDVEAAIAGKTGIVLRWDLAGIHFLGMETHPEIGSPDAGVEP